MSYETLLVPTDGSDPAAQAAAHAFDLAARVGATIHVLSVADSSVAASASHADESPTIRDRLRERAETHANGLVDRARTRDLDAVAAVREGLPAVEITDYAESNGVDAIVMGTHGRSGLTRAVAGSVAETVVRTAPVPVITVGPEAMDDDHGAPAEDAPVRVAFVCVRNAGRSQMATAFAQRERERRGLEDRVTVLTGGTQPAAGVHEVVVEAMSEAGFDVSGRTPREISVEELRSCDYVATMGCTTLDVGEVGDDVDVRDWDLDDPGEQDLDRVREIRDEIDRRVSALFDEFDLE